MNRRERLPPRRQVAAAQALLAPSRMVAEVLPEVDRTTNYQKGRRMSFVFHRGEYIRDQVTGFAGIVIGRCDYLTGCNTYLLQPASIGSDGKRPEAEWFDEMRLEYDPNHLGKKITLYRPNEQPPG